MSDARLRELERRFRTTGTPEDLEAVMQERARVGNREGAVLAARELLEQDADKINARNILADYAPLQWTGTVGYYHGPPKVRGEKNPWFLTVKERDNPAREVPLSSFEVMKEAHVVDLAYAGNCLTILVEEIVRHPRAKYSRIDITPTSQTTHDFPGEHTIYQCTLHTDHTREIIDVMRSTPAENLPIHTSTQLPRIYAERDDPNAVRRIYSGNDATIVGNNGRTPWMHEDGNVHSSSFQTLFFQENGRVPADVDGRGYGNTRIPITSRMMRGENRAQSDAHLASAFDGQNGLHRVIVEVPITILNVLRGMK